MTKIYLLHRSHRVLLEDFGAQSVRMREYSSIEEARKTMNCTVGSCLIIRGEVVDHNCLNK